MTGEADVSRNMSPLKVGDRVMFRDYHGVIDRISPEGIHFRVKFDAGEVPDWSQIIDGGCYFYGPELVLNVLKECGA